MRTRDGSFRLLDRHGVGSSVPIFWGEASRSEMCLYRRYLAPHVTKAVAN